MMWCLLVTSRISNVSTDTLSIFSSRVVFYFFLIPSWSRSLTLYSLNTFQIEVEMLLPGPQTEPEPSSTPLQAPEHPVPDSSFVPQSEPPLTETRTVAVPDPEQEEKLTKLEHELSSCKQTIKMLVTDKADMSKSLTLFQHQLQEKTSENAQEF